MTSQLFHTETLKSGFILKRSNHRAQVRECSDLVMLFSRRVLLLGCECRVAHRRFCILRRRGGVQKTPEDGRAARAVAAAGATGNANGERGCHFALSRLRPIDQHKPHLFPPPMQRIFLHGISACLYGCGYAAKDSAMPPMVTDRACTVRLDWNRKKLLCV